MPMGGGEATGSKGHLSMPANKRAAAAKVRIFLVDDHPIVRKGFQMLLGMEPDLTVCGEADSGPVALE